jgi:hypothetical protein
MQHLSGLCWAATLALVTEGKLEFHFVQWTGLGALKLWSVIANFGSDVNPWSNPHEI